MAKNSKKTAKHLIDPRKARKANRPSFIWSLSALLAICGGLCILACVGLSSWRVTDEMTVRYIKGTFVNTPNTIIYNPTYYGLYLVKFNDGSITRPWYTLEQTVCAGVDYLAPLMQGISILPIWSGSCDQQCLNHFRTRCQVYKQQSTLGLLTIGVLTLGGVAALIGGGWFYIVGVSSAVFQICWTGCAVLMAASLGWYVWTSDEHWKLLRVNSVFPYPSLGISYYVTALGVSFIFFAGLVAMLGGWWDARVQWNKKKEQIQKRIIEEAGGGDIELYGNESPGGPPPPFGGGPGGPGGPPGGRPGPPPGFGQGFPGRPGFPPGPPPPGRGFQGRPFPPGPPPGGRGFPGGPPPGFQGGPPPGFHGGPPPGFQGGPPPGFQGGPPPPGFRPQSNYGPH